MHLDTTTGAPDSVSGAFSEYAGPRPKRSRALRWTGRCVVAVPRCTLKSWMQSLEFAVCSFIICVHLWLKSFLHVSRFTHHARPPTTPHSASSHPDLGSFPFALRRCLDNYFLHEKTLRRNVRHLRPRLRRYRRDYH